MTKKIKDLSWFKFSPLNYMTGRIRRESDIVQAHFLVLCSMYWKNSCEMTYEAASLEIPVESLEVLCAKRIVKRDGDNIYITFLDEQLVDIDEAKQKKREAANKRWGKGGKGKTQPKGAKSDNAEVMQNDAGAMHVHTDAMQNDAEKRREDKTPYRGGLSSISSSEKNEPTLTAKALCEGLASAWPWNSPDEKRHAYELIQTVNEEHAERIDKDLEDSDAILDMGFIEWISLYQTSWK